MTPTSRFQAWLSPSLIVGSSVLLAAILLVVAFKNIQRERAFMEQTLLSQARILVRSLEAGTRTGMMGHMRWGRGQLQVLMEQMVQQPHVFFLRLQTPSGAVKASAGPELNLPDLPVPAASGATEVTRLVRLDGAHVFVYARPYAPWTRPGREPCPMDGCATPIPETQGRRGPVGLGRSGLGTDRDAWVVVGLDAGPYQSALRQDLRQNALILAVLFIVGAAGLVSLFWAHHYRLARRSLKDMEILTETILSRMPVGLVVLDQDGTAQRINDSARQLLGQERLSGSLKDAPDLGPLVTSALRDKVHMEEELRLGDRDSPERYVFASVSPLDRAGTSPALYLLLLSDTTRLRRLEKKLHRSEHLASLGRLAAGVAHEIRNPLSSIKGFATILAGKAAGDPSAQKISTAFQHEVDRLNRVVTELLEFARPPDLQWKRTSVGQLLEHTVRLVEKDAEDAGVSIQIHIDPPDLEMEADGDRLAQVLLNLYLNAIQAMEGGGTLRISVCREGESAVVSIQDTGPGIPKDVLGRIFDPYFTTKPRGVGLGLAIVHRVVEAHQGEVTVHSEPGSGTRFVLRLPLRPTDSADSLEPANESAIRSVAGLEHKTHRRTGETP
ncbi:two-component system, NtrC family, sensor histidine kinase HydH [Desulfacinum hydrothermale DSM 13146]|uniref:histidine kinase n=1 Tax=Desulfacinum hydrothermale DSM 13146 TaxID=1121390 RepID=A0A1W1XP40_9BACT|nr:ATP-binding protein [Desulfacinum hydrothermale]SMC25622.1 two-component system, NtrC family, sensor histidine kinase HydH [Desulfacinum hydrothermale DSM 13146]